MGNSLLISLVDRYFRGRLFGGWFWDGGFHIVQKTREVRKGKAGRPESSFSCEDGDISGLFVCSRIDGI